ncbi:hypothetical protein C1646_771849 [Rhizophagus diaphanus]|nr:hypothetical protein C1646_771849 [Rhizophagus diaphanus] [Rhizophagus sp. MUCL 43196]
MSELSTSQEDLYFPVHDIEPQVILTSKNVLFIDIDDILSLFTKTENGKILHQTIQACLIPSSNIKTAKRQTEHFERNCRKVLRMEVIKLEGTSSVSSKLGTAKRANFLFLKSQKINHKIQHLRYKKVGSISDSSDYDFSISHHFNLIRFRTTFDSYCDDQCKTTVKEVSYYGTSTKHLELRQKMVHFLTDWNNEFHSHMTLYNNIFSRINKKYAGTNRLKFEMDILLATYVNISIPTNKQYCNAHYTGLVHDFKGNSFPVNPYTSSDTADLESHPFKRDVNINSNLSSHLKTSKRSHQALSSTIALDSEQAGPLKVVNN